MSDEPGGKKPPSQHEYTVELAGVELDALRSSSEHVAAALAGAKVADEVARPEDATNPKMSRADLGDLGVGSQGSEPTEDPTAMIDRASLRALTESQEAVAVKRQEPASESEDATRSIDRGALAHIIDAKSAPRPFGIRKRTKDTPHSKKTPKASPKLPSLAKLKSTLEAVSELPTAERERPHMTSLELPSRKPGSGLGSESSVSGPEFKLPSLKRPEIVVSALPAEPSEEADESDEAEYDLEPISNAEESEPVEAAPDASGEDVSTEDAPAADMDASEDAAGEVSASGPTQDDSEAEPSEPDPLESQEHAPQEDVATGASGDDVFDDDPEEHEEHEERAEEPDGDDVGDDEGDDAGAPPPRDVTSVDVSVEPEEIQEDASSVSTEHALMEVDEGGLEASAGGKPWAKNLVILGALMCAVGGVVGVVVTWSTGLPLFLTGAVCVLAGLAFRR